jgi:hypothetical protein
MCHATSYGFAVMPLKTSLVWELIMVGLFAVQIIANLKSHRKNSRQETAGATRVMN